MEPLIDPETGKFLCYCGRNFTRISDHKRHALFRCGYFKCDYCSYSITDKFLMMNHMRNKHREKAFVVKDLFADGNDSIKDVVSMESSHKRLTRSTNVSKSYSDVSACSKEEKRSENHSEKGDSNVKELRKSKRLLGEREDPCELSARTRKPKNKTNIKAASLNEDDMGQVPKIIITQVKHLSEDALSDTANGSSQSSVEIKRNFAKKSTTRCALLYRKERSIDHFTNLYDHVNKIEIIDSDFIS